MADRDSRGRFVPGNKASPGRPKLPEGFKARAKEYADEALDRLAEIMRDASAKHSDVIRACELLIERGYGRVTQAADMGDEERKAGGGVVLMPAILGEETENE